MTRATTRGLALLIALAAPLPLRGQADSATVVAGAHFRASALQEWLLGADYRQLWTTPVRVPVLELARFAGGLTPTEAGGGLQTRSLHLLGADGREYVFRSVMKWPDFERDPALEGTVVSDIVDDQVSSLHPAGALVVAPLAAAAGLLHATPRMFVMPDDPRLGEFRRDFAGMLGQIEERPDEPEEGERPGFGGFLKITGTDKLLERLEESPEHRVDARTFLRARLFDLWIGDWDRHADNWRWAGDERGDVTYWLPIPRDRDYAFVDYDGQLLALARRVSPNTVKFEPKIRNVYGLSLNGQELDRLFLTGLDRAAWDSVAADLRARLTDAAIDEAVAHMPPEYRAGGGAELASRLKARRGDIPRAAAELYALLSRMVDIQATDEPELAELERRPDGSLLVRITALDARGAPKGPPYYQRAFQRGETDEVRLYLHGGDDHAIVRGEAEENPVVRVIGGGGDDVLVDSSRVRGRVRHTGFYDDRGDNRLVAGPGGTSIDRAPFVHPDPSRPISGQDFRDWGRRLATLPSVDYRGTEGIIVGGGPVFTQYGFRQVPYSYRLAALGQVALGTGHLALDLAGDFRHVGSRAGLLVHARASQLETLRFYGYGNETPFAPTDRVRVPLDQLLVSAAVSVPSLLGSRLSLGPVLKYTRPEVRPGSVLAGDPVLGSEEFGQAGAQLTLLLDRRDSRFFPRRGLLLRAGGSAYPAAWSAREAFGDLYATASTYLSLPGAAGPTLALRAGGRRLWGDYPLHEAAFLGGTSTVRGYYYQRYAGDALAFGNAELRAPLFPAKLLIRGRVGALALADVGRVFAPGQASREWHGAAGAGLWFSFALRESRYAVSLAYARGERDALYLRLGMPF